MGVFFHRNGKKKMEGKNGKSSEAIAFNLFDMNNDGTITKHEMMNMSKNLTKEQVTNYKGILAHLILLLETMA